MQNFIQFLGNYKEDTGSSSQNNLYSFYCVTLAKKNLDTFKKFLKDEIIVTSIAKEDTYIFEKEKVSLIISFPDELHEIARLVKFLHEHQ